MRSPTRVALPLLVALVAEIGCGTPQGAGLWNLKIGGRARLVSPDGSDVVLETLVTSPKAKAGRVSRTPATPTVETTTVPAGTMVDVLAIDGDDARIRIQDGLHTGLTTWVECARLELVTP